MDTLNEFPELVSGQDEEGGYILLRGIVSDPVPFDPQALALNSSDAEGEGGLAGSPDSPKQMTPI